MPIQNTTTCSYSSTYLIRLIQALLSMSSYQRNTSGKQDKYDGAHWGSLLSFNTQSTDMENPLLKHKPLQALSLAPPLPTPYPIQPYPDLPATPSLSSSPNA